SAACRVDHRGLQAARRGVCGGEPAAPQRDPDAVSRVAAARGRRRRRREPQGLPDRGEQRADDPQRRQQSHALPGRVGGGVDQALAHLFRRAQPRLRTWIRRRTRARLRGVQPVHAAVGDRRGGGDPVRGADAGLARAAVRPQGGDRRARHEVGARPRDADLPEAALPGRLGLGGSRRAPVPSGRGTLSESLPDAARRGSVSVSAADRRIRRLRPPKPHVDPYVAHGTVREEERRPDGRIERALTVFLAGAECPFTCSFCDLWRYTIDGPTPPGALATHVEKVLNSAAPPLPQRIKLYNASNFFDRRAVPLADRDRLAALADPFAGVTVESHVNTIGRETLAFA